MLSAGMLYTDGAALSMTTLESSHRLAAKPSLKNVEGFANFSPLFSGDDFS